MSAMEAVMNMMVLSFKMTQVMRQLKISSTSLTCMSLLYSIVSRIDTLAVTYTHILDLS